MSAVESSGSCLRCHEHKRLVPPGALCSSCLAIIDSEVLEDAELLLRELILRERVAYGEALPTTVNTLERLQHWRHYGEDPVRD